MAGTSTAKYIAMRDALCGDGRVHGMLQVLWQPTGQMGGAASCRCKDLPQEPIEDLDFARVVKKETSGYGMCYGNVPDLRSHSSSVRRLLQKDTFMVCDFSADRGA